MGLGILRLLIGADSGVYTEAPWGRHSSDLRCGSAGDRLLRLGGIGEKLEYGAV